MKKLPIIAMFAVFAAIAGCNDHQVKNLSSTEIAAKFAVEEILLDPHSAKWGEFVSSPDKSMMCGAVKSRDAEGVYSGYLGFAYSVSDDMLLWEADDPSVREYCGGLRLAQGS